MAAESDHILPWVAVSTAMITATFGVFGLWLKEKIAGRQARDRELSAAGVQGQQNIFTAYDALISRLQEDMRIVRAQYQELQANMVLVEKSLAECRRESRSLSLQNEEQAGRILALESRLPGIDSDYES